MRRTGAATAQKASVGPPAPRRIGLITGAAAAGGADVRSVLESSLQRFEIRERIVPLTGPDAPAAVARELSALGAGDSEVIVVARGGGARSELTVWDSSDVAEAVARCPLPVWAAIGHATDSTGTGTDQWDVGTRRRNGAG